MINFLFLIKSIWITVDSIFNSISLINCYLNTLFQLVSKEVCKFNVCNDEKIIIMNIPHELEAI